MDIDKFKKMNNTIDEILKTSITIEEKKSLPKPENSQYTFDNGIKVWTSAIFVDIVESTTMFGVEEQQEVSKKVRAFTSEIVNILNLGENVVQVGIRGDCVFAIYTTPTLDDVHEIFEKCITINTFLNILNARIKENNMKPIYAGIGMSTSNDLVIKAGKKGLGVNDLIWLGKAVSEASNLSGIANRNGRNPIYISSNTHYNIVGYYKGNEDWFVNDIQNGAYGSSLIWTSANVLF